MSIIEAEAMSLKEALQKAINMNSDCVIFESDSQVMAQAIHSNATGSSKSSIMVLSSKWLLKSLPNFEVKFIKRQVIMVAQLLAKATNS